MNQVERITPYDPELAKSITKEGQRIVRELTHALEDKISMNERIKELAEQAKDWAYADHDGYTAQMLFEQKFAELIVRECAQVIKDCEKYGCHLPLEWEVMEHFGVEE